MPMTLWQRQGMSAETMEFHHDLHHKAYVDNGKQADRRDRVGENAALEDIITGTYQAGAVAQNGIFNTSASIGTITSSGK